MSENEDMLAKVRKLLAKAENAATSAEEAEAYNAKVAELIAAYGIERAKLALDEPASDQLEHRTVTIQPPYARDKVGLLAAVARPLRAHTLASVRKGAKTVHLFGYGSDLDRARVLYDSLVIQAMRGLPTILPRPGGRSLAAYRRSWLAGFAEAVEQRLARAERDAAREHEQATSSTSLSLMLADRYQRARAASRQEFPHQKTTTRTLSGGGDQQGRQAGQRADLGTSRIAHGRVSLPQGRR